MSERVEFCKRLAKLAAIAKEAQKRYDEEQDAFYEEMVGQYWPTSTNRMNTTEGDINGENSSM